MDSHISSSLQFGVNPQAPNAAHYFILKELAGLSLPNFGQLSHILSESESVPDLSENEKIFIKSLLDRSMSGYARFNGTTGLYEVQDDSKLRYSNIGWRIILTFYEVFLKNTFTKFTTKKVTRHLRGA